MAIRKQFTLIAKGLTLHSGVCPHDPEDRPAKYGQ